jgi:two-component system, NtrC family, sensor kinase
VDPDAQIVLWNRFMEIHSRRAATDVIGRNLFECFPDLPRRLVEKKLAQVFTLRNYAFTDWEHRPFLFRFDHDRPVTGGHIDAMRHNCTFRPLLGPDGEVTHVCVTVFDCTDAASAHQRLEGTLRQLEDEHAQQKILMRKLEDANLQVLQSEKLASIGQLAAGVAHEINNPVGFVNSNLGSLQAYVESLLRFTAAVDGLELGEEQRATLTALKKEIDLDFLREDVGSLLRESLEGLDRVKRIVQDLKDFSRIDQPDWQMTDLHHCIDSTLNMVKNEIKYKAEVEKNYGDLPEIECVPSQLNQVFMNLLVNAAHAIKDHGVIRIRTCLQGDKACVAIQDTGCGIAPDVVKRIFEPFFTTKPVGKGTGLGLSVSYNIVTRHGGTIEVTTEPGNGTEFRVLLPLRQ